ncbi:MAG: hypothetical protein K6E52_00635 [Bacteroidaceae bacterium]|nr:hypothetical protein [Bacteroidaceae bacterium]
MQFPFGQEVKPLRQEDRTPKKVFVLGVYASAVHAQWKRNGKVVCPALAVASEPRIFWDGNPAEAAEIISRISIPPEVGTLEPAGRMLNGPSAKVLDEHFLAPLDYTRKDAWLCDLLPESRLNAGLMRVIRSKYNPLIDKYHLNVVTLDERPSVFCDDNRREEILQELIDSQAELLVLLGDIPILQFLNEVAIVPYSSLQEYVNLYGYGNPSDVAIGPRLLRVLPLAHPRQIGALGSHSEKWFRLHQQWERHLIEKLSK